MGAKATAAAVCKWRRLSLNVCALSQRARALTLCVNCNASALIASDHETAAAAAAAAAKQQPQQQWE